MSEEKSSIMEEFEGEASASFMEFILPKLIPQVEPVMKMVKKHLGNDVRRLLLSVDSESGQLVLTVIETEGIESMDIAEGKFKVIPLDKYKDMLLNGGTEEILKEIGKEEKA